MIIIPKLIGILQYLKKIPNNLKGIIINKHMLLLKPQNNLILLLILFAFSCEKPENQKKEIEQYLTSGSEKYWTGLRPYLVNHYTGVLYKADGTLVNYTIDSETGKRYISESYKYAPFW